MGPGTEGHVYTKHLQSVSKVVGQLSKITNDVSMLSLPCPLINVGCQCLTVLNVRNVTFILNQHWFGEPGEIVKYSCKHATYLYLLPISVGVPYTFETDCTSQELYNATICNCL